MDNISSVPSRATSSVLHPNHSSGISKKQKHQKPLKRKQRLRLEVGRGKAENVRDKTELRMLDSLSRDEGRRKRRRKWEEVDDAIRKTLDSGGKTKSKATPHETQVNVNEQGTLKDDQVEMTNADRDGSIREAGEEIS